MTAPEMTADIGRYITIGIEGYSSLRRRTVGSVGDPSESRWSRTTRFARPDSTRAKASLSRSQYRTDASVRRASVRRARETGSRTSAATITCDLDHWVTPRIMTSHGVTVRGGNPVQVG